MALIKCPECGKEISDLAEKCPHCGCPINQSTQLNYGQPIAVQQVNTKNKNSTLGVLSLIFSILGCTFIVGIILAIIDLSKKDGKKKTLSIIALVICGIWLLLVIAGNTGDTQSTSNNVVSEKEDEPKAETQSESNAEVRAESEEDQVEDSAEVESKDKYHVGDTWQNKHIKVTYTDCYEFTDYNQYNAPADGNKIICAEFEFENIGNSDSTVMYTDFHGYADGYEVDQSYAPDGTGLDFTVKMSAGRKGTGKVAFEVPENSSEIEIEFSPNFWTSENIIFVYE